jgi:phosphoglucomutase
MMKKYRTSPPKTINESEVIKIADYQSSELQDIEKSTVSKIDLPKSNVLQFITADGSKISIRPSGTEPKIKFYFSVRVDMPAIEDYEKVNGLLELRINNIKNELGVS